MEECLAIKPDLIFLWDEAWFGFARFSPFYRAAHGDGRRADLKTAFADPAYLERYLAQDEAAGRRPRPQGCARARHAAHARPAQGQAARLPDQLDAQVDVRRCGRARWSWWPTRTSTCTSRRSRRPYFTHTSTSPNQQIIASLDVARRQMELEGYETGHAGDPARDRDPRGGQHASADLEVLPRARRRRHDSGRVPAIRAQELHGAGRDLGGRRPRLPRRRVHPRPDPPHAASAGPPATTARSSRALLATEYDIQLNKTSRNSVLLQTNINNTRSDVAQPAQGAGRHLQGDRPASQERR